MDVRQGPLHRRQEVALVILLDEVRQHLGIGLGDEGMPRGGKLFPQLPEVGDGAVMHHGDTTGAVGVGMGVHLVPLAVGRPPRMPDAHRPGVFFKLLRQLVHPHGVLEHRQLAVSNGDAAGVVAAILQPGQSIEQYGLGFPDAAVADNSAHGS